MSSQELHLICIVWVKDQLFQLFKLITGEYSVGIHQRIGQKEKGIIVLIQKMKIPGYFLLTTKLNLKFSQTKNKMQLEINMIVWFFLVEDMIFVQELTVPDLQITIQD